LLPLAYPQQIKYPENFFLLRGNHECASINRIYGFYDECKRRYNIRLWRTFTDCFNCLPVSALIDEKVGFTAISGAGAVRLGAKACSIQACILRACPRCCVSAAEGYLGFCRTRLTGAKGHVEAPAADASS
jgi:hypothetical protein